MKNFVFILLTLAPVVLQAQISLNEWITCSPVTDSSHHNRNACLMGKYANNIVFWDQEIDASTTRLCYKNLSDPPSETRIALEQTGVQLTHPMILQLVNSVNDNASLIIYQTNEGNDIDLKFMIYNGDGTFSASSVISELPGNDINLVINQYMVAWENNGKIFAAEYLWESQTFTTPFPVETNGGFSPTFRNNSLDYLIAGTDSTKLVSNQIQYNQGVWTVNETTVTSFAGQCSGANSYVTWFGNNLAMQQALPGKQSGIVVTDPFRGENYISSPQYNYTEPAVCDYMIGVKSDLEMYFLAYVSDSLTQAEIFVINPVMFSGPVNISRWSGIDRNPRIFVTFPDYYYIRVYLFWESEREGHSTLYRSYLDYIFGGTEEKQKTGTITVSPCPFNQETTIRLQATGDILLEILDLQGRKVKTLSPQKEANGWQKAVWDGTNQQGKSVPAGSYMVVSRTGNLTQSTIIIRN